MIGSSHGWIRFHGMLFIVVLRIITFEDAKKTNDNDTDCRSTAEECTSKIENGQ